MHDRETRRLSDALQGTVRLVNGVHVLLLSFRTTWWYEERVRGQALNSAQLRLDLPMAYVMRPTRPI